MEYSTFKRVLFGLFIMLLMTNFSAKAQPDSTFFTNLQDDLDLFSPDSSLGDKNWGLISLSVANMRADSRHASEMVSQVVMGTPVRLIEESENWIKVESPEGYNGWVDTTGLVRLTAQELDKWKQSNRYVYNRLSGYSYSSTGKNAKILSDMVLGDLFVVTGKKAGYLKVLFPDGRTGLIRKDECLSWNDWTNRKKDIPAMLTLIKQMMGSPYLWGGTSAKSVDCSGLVKIAYLSQSIILERDASQQAKNGEMVDITKPETFKPGDLLFFGLTPEKITHVGIYLGNGYYIHSSGSVHINNIDRNHPDFNFATKKHIVAARRIISELNTEGIVEVKYHPWYSLQAK